MMKLVKVARGTETVLEESGNRRKLNRRLTQLRGSTRGGKVSGHGGKKYPVEYKLVD